jgi:hypothetical protein
MTHNRTICDVLGSCSRLCCFPGVRFWQLSGLPVFWQQCWRHRGWACTGVIPDNAALGLGADRYRLQCTFLSVSSRRLCWKLSRLQVQLLHTDAAVPIRTGVRIRGAGRLQLLWQLSTAARRRRVRPQQRRLCDRLAVCGQQRWWVQAPAGDTKFNQVELSIPWHQCVHACSSRDTWTLRVSATPCCNAPLPHHVDDHVDTGGHTGGSGGGLARVHCQGNVSSSSFTGNSALQVQREINAALYAAAVAIISIIMIFEGFMAKLEPCRVVVRIWTAALLTCSATTCSRATL